MARLTLINHASLLVEAGGIGLLSDPWYRGDAFDHGWSLYADTPPVHNWGHSVTHVWISHEHPDHFSIETLKAYREHLMHARFLYKRTRDRRVVGFLRGLGFDVQELEDGKVVRLGPSMEILTKQVGTEDSLIVVRADGDVLLNTNDAVVTDADLRIVREFGLVFGQPTVLASQFTIAGKVGNAADDHARERAAGDVRRLLFLQAQAVDARFVLPFAGFKYFSHPENYYLNSGVPSVLSVLDEGTLMGMQVAVLWPGESMDMQKGRDPSLSLAAAARHRKALEAAKPQGSPAVKVSMQALLDSGADWIRANRAAHSKMALALLAWLPGSYGLRNMFIHISDLDEWLRLNNLGIRPCKPRRTRYSMEITSSALACVFANSFGGMTLMINGRFQASPAAVKRWRAYSQLGTMRSSMQRLTLRWLLSNAVRALGFMGRRDHASTDRVGAAPEQERGRG